LKESGASNRGRAISSGSEVSSRGASSVWARQVEPQAAQRTVRPTGPSLRSSTKYRVAQSGQVSIMTGESEVRPLLP
jgi:hypothetical protein